MLLAGGEGKRLGSLTKELAKPAVPFGGKYRIIDFTLSNCANSGIQTLGVMTQYSPLELNKHIGNGKPWDLNRQNGGVTIFPLIQQKMAETGILVRPMPSIKIFILSINMTRNMYLSFQVIIFIKWITQNCLEHHKETGADATISVNPSILGRSISVWNS